MILTVVTSLFTVVGFSQDLYILAQDILIYFLRAQTMRQMVFYSTTNHFHESGKSMACQERSSVYHICHVGCCINITKEEFLDSYCPIFVSLCELYPPCPVLNWQERHPVGSSAAVAHLLQGSMCCVFRDGILHISVVTSGYLSYCCLSIISNQSAHSPLTSDLWHQQGIFIHTIAVHWIFSLFVQCIYMYTFILIEFILYIQIFNM